MQGQRVIIKVARPQGNFDYPTNLTNTKGTIAHEFQTGGALIICDTDNCLWAFQPDEFEVIDEGVGL